MENNITSLLIEECKFRLVDESIPRLHKCLDKLSEQEIWYRPNKNTVSIGNLVLHLCGNVTQWLISGLGGAPDNRRRQQEFDEPGPLPTSSLHEMLDNLATEITAVVEGLGHTSTQQRIFHPGLSCIRSIYSGARGGTFLLPRWAGDHHD